MTIWANVENNEIKGVVDFLPMSWKNISNIPALERQENYELLKEYGWYKIIKDTTPYDQTSQKIDKVEYELLDNEVYERISFKPKDQPFQDMLLWNAIREERDKLMKEFEWRYTRYERQVRLGQEPTDSLEELDEYMDYLANITRTENPRNVLIPQYSRKK